MSGYENESANVAFRPAPWSLPPDGFHWEVVEQTDWISPPVGAGRCRFMEGRKMCGDPADATLMRRHHSKFGTRQVPWDYCARHLYGRWMENGKVLGWRLVEDSDE